MEKINENSINYNDKNLVCFSILFQSFLRFQVLLILFAYCLEFYIPYFKSLSFPTELHHTSQTDRTKPAGEHSGAFGSKRVIYLPPEWSELASE